MSCVRGEGAIRSAHVLVSDHCNHACLHCYQVHGKKGELTLAEIERLLDELASMGVLFLTLSGGESTLRSDLPDILRAARKRSFAITLLTNAFAMSEELHAAIVDTGVWQVRVSIYSDRAEEHDANTCVPGSFEATCANVRRLRAAGIDVRLVSTLTSMCTADTARLEAFAASLGCAIEVHPGMTSREDGVGAPLEVMATDERLVEHYDVMVARGDALPTVDEKLASAPCGVCSDEVVIHSNGSVRPCTHIPVELARAGVDDLSRLSSDPAYEMLGSIRWRDIHGCRDCALVDVCARCHGSAVFETGDLLGPQPSACHRAIVRHEQRHGVKLVVMSRSPNEGNEANEGADRADGVGPFELVETRAGRVLKPIPDVTTEADEALVRRFPWIRSQSREIRAMAGLVPASALVRQRDTGREIANIHGGLPHESRAN